ncbi:MAG: hypothetical protein JWN30_1367, partial [Bacilli bacterium]|nr:hypothetical protein [Bacilli bacterium]
MNCWTYIAILDESVSIEQSALNTTIDPELREFIEKVMAAASSQSRRLKDFLQVEGVPLPPESE